MPKFSELFTGTPGRIEQLSTLRPEQEGLYNQLVNSGQQRGAGGAFGTASDYYRNLLSDDSQDMQAFAAPELRRYRQEIMPGISEEFAKMGAGALGSSGFRNAQTQGGVDLAERLGAIRANLRHSGAAGLQNIGQLGLQSFQQNYEVPGSEGLLSSLAPALGTAALGGALGGWLGGLAKGGQNKSPYQGSNAQASPTVPPRQPLPGFLQGASRGGY